MILNLKLLFLFPALELALSFKFPSFKIATNLNELTGNLKIPQNSRIGDGTIAAQLRNQLTGSNLTAEDVVAQRKKIVLTMQQKLQEFKAFVGEYRTWGRPGELVYNNQSSQYEKRKVYEAACPFQVY